MVQKSQTTTGWMVLKPWKSWHFNYHYLNWLYSRVSGCHQLHLPFFAYVFSVLHHSHALQRAHEAPILAKPQRANLTCEQRWRNVDVRVVLHRKINKLIQTGIPTIHFQVRTASLREGRSNSHFDGCLLVENNFVSDVIHNSNCSLKLDMPETSMKKTVTL